VLEEAAEVIDAIQKANGPIFITSELRRLAASKRT
jgi:hypothetical protein